MADVRIVPRERAKVWEPRVTRDGPEGRCYLCFGEGLRFNQRNFKKEQCYVCKGSGRVRSLRQRCHVNNCEGLPVYLVLSPKLTRCLCEKHTSQFAKRSGIKMPGEPKV